MALATYTDLKASVATFSGRQDLTTPIPDFIAIAHARINRVLRSHPRMQKRNDAFSVTGEYVAVPTDFRELRSMYIQSSPRQEIAMQYDNWVASETSVPIPRYVTIVGSTTPGVEYFRFGPPPSGTLTVTIEYVAYLTAMSAGSDHNWVLDEHPEVYLYGSLVSLAAYMKDPEAAQGYQALYDAAIHELITAGRRTRASGPPIRTQPA
jgi:hypothetical protein